MLDDLAQLNQLNHREFGDPEIATRIAQYEMAYRMQTSVPELTDLSDEPDRVFDLYGPDVAQARHLRRQLPAGPPAGRARRALHPALPRGWDQHTHLPKQIAGQCRDTDSRRPRWSPT